MRRLLPPLALGLRLRLMLTLAVVATFPVAFVSYVVVRSEVDSLTRGISYELRDTALAAQSRFSKLLDRQQLAAVTAASSPHLQTALRRHDGATLERFAARRGLVLEVGSRRYGRPLPDAAHARVQLLRAGRSIGWIVAQVPLDAATLRKVIPPGTRDVRLSFVDLHRTQPARGVTLRLTPSAGIHAALPPGTESARTDATYRRVGGAGLLALLALMVLAFLLARPLLRALRWVEVRANEAGIDALTGVANRRALEESLGAEISRAERFGHALAVVLLDLDHFKRTNDTFGHASGDLLLRAVSKILSSTARQGDTVARFGGEEFVVVLPETDLDGACRLAERLRVAIAAHRVGQMRMTASFGVATLLAEDGVGSLLAAADQALYQAKENGRNRVESAVRPGPPAPPEPAAASAA